MVYSGASSDYLVLTNVDGSKTVTDRCVSLQYGTDTLIGIPNLAFAAGIPRSSRPEPGLPTALATSVTAASSP